ncbi:flagellar hook-length control protein FliK [Massilia aurea]|uniref:flagellar hook-length control protein FliK n=1 Tax=Massilia aurea TaxID=373040 RepID=UPI0034626264
MSSTMNNANYGAGNTLGKPAGVTGNPGAPAPDAPVSAAGSAAKTAAKTVASPGATSGPTPGASSTAADGAAPVEALPFGYWIALDGALPQAPLPGSAAAAPQDDTAVAPGATPGEAAEVLDDTTATATDIVLAAMAPPVAPVTMPAMMLAMPGFRPDPAADAAEAPAAGDAPAALAQVAATRGPPPLAAAVPATAPVAAPVAAPAAPSAQATGQVIANAAAPVAATAANSEHTAPDAGAGADAVTAGAGVSAAVSPGASARGADSIVLAGPPAAWRQNLHEALGERLQLQLGRNIEQATIRLEPPMLGRIEIAIRHNGGNLEVHIAASNTEVLRQLNTVSDTLRNDLAGRQYSSVSVNVTEVPRAQAGSQAFSHGGADGQGRPRQEQSQDRTPGQALRDADDAGSPFFSMT